MRRVGSRLRARQVAVAISLLCLFAVGAIVFRANPMSDEWRELSSDFCELVNTLGTTLEPGGSGVIHVPESDVADELVLLPVGCTRMDLSRRFPDRPTEFIDNLLTLSRDDRICPALIWLRNGSVISVNPAKFTVGVNLTLQSWKTRGRRGITVTKELQSTNGFLSVSLSEEKQ